MWCARDRGLTGRCCRAPGSRPRREVSNPSRGPVLPEKHRCGVLRQTLPRPWCSDAGSAAASSAARGGGGCARPLGSTPTPRPPKHPFLRGLRHETAVETLGCGGAGPSGPVGGRASSWARGPVRQPPVWCRWVTPGVFHLGHLCEQRRTPSSSLPPSRSRVVSSDRAGRFEGGSLLSRGGPRREWGWLAWGWGAHGGGRRLCVRVCTVSVSCGGRAPLDLVAELRAPPRPQGPWAARTPHACQTPRSRRALRSCPVFAETP